VTFMDVEAGMVPELVVVNEPSTTFGGDAGFVPVRAHVDGTVELSMPAMDTPISKVVAAGRPVPVIATDPLTLATVGVAVRLAPRLKTLSPY
jgi:uncharacterized protein (DUF2126 family)